MKNLATSYPSAQIFLKEEGFTVSLTGKPRTVGSSHGDDN